MSAEVKWLTDAIPKGKGWALDLGGGRGTMRSLVERKGWRYVSIDIHPINNKASQMVFGDAHTLPFPDNLFSLIILKDALEHFWDPWEVMCEVRRVLKDSGTLIIWVPFMHPFHGDDYYRYTPLAIRKLLGGFRIIRFDAPLWVFSVLGLAAIEILKRMRLVFLARPVREFAWHLDRLLQPGRNKPRSFAGAYFIVAVRERSTH